MKFEEISVGRQEMARVRPSGSETLPKGPVRLFHRALDGTTCVETVDHVIIPVSPVDRDAIASLNAMVDAGERALVRVIDGRSGTWLLEGRVLSGRHHRETWTLHLAPELQENLPRANIERWLEQELVWNGHLFAWAGKGRVVALDQAFRLHGRDIYLDITPRDGVLVATHKGRARSQAGGLLLTGTLDVRTDDSALVKDALKHMDDADTDQVASAASSFLDLWESYRQAEQDILAATAERLGERPYRSWDQPQAGEIRFTMASPLPREWSGLDARVDLEVADDRRPIHLGSLIRPERGARKVHVKLADRDILPPPHGRIRVSTRGDRIRLDRQRKAIEQVRSDSAQLPGLLDVLDGNGRTHRPDKRIGPDSPSVRRLLDFPLTPSQREAVDVALNTPDAAYIQGPPGSGKTTVIQVIAQRLHDEGRAPILLTSYQHEAVLRVIDGVTVGGLPVIRVGGRRGEDLVTSLSTIDEWLGELVETVDASLGRRNAADPWKAMREQAWRLVVAYQRDPGGREGSLALVRELRRIVGTRLSAELLARLDVTEARLARVAPAVHSLSDVDRQRITTLLRKQRLDTVAWSDDGPDAARRLYRAVKRIDGRPDDLVHDLSVAQARRYDDGPPDGFETLVERLGDWLKPAEVETEDDGVAETESVALACVGWLEHLAEREGEGVSDALRRFRDVLQSDPEVVRRVLGVYANALGATVQQAVGKDMRNLHEFFDTVIVDEAARANPLDLLIPLTLARRIILVGDQLQLPHILEPRLERALERDRGKVGDVLRESLFGRLCRLYTTSPPGGIPRHVMLDRQFRMHPVIGTFVSETFYDGRLHNRVDPADRPPVGEDAPFDRPVAWFDVPRIKSDRTTWERGRYFRPAEAERVENVVRNILSLDADATVGVISFYAEQAELLARMVEDNGWGGRVRAGTVDAFQGREFDAVVLSTVRSGGRVGFLALPNRMNVAMSRGRRFLGVVGDMATVRQVPALDAFVRLCEREGHRVQG